MDILQMLKDLFGNSMIINTLAAWFIAQALKIVFHMFTEGEFNWKRMFGAGGMPSSHMSTTVALVCSCGWLYGLDSPYFAIAVTLAVIVMHDAVGVRRETDKQSRTIKQIADIIDDISEEDVPDIRTDKLKDFVGHTPIQVAFGAIIGIAVVALHMLILKIPYGSGAFPIVFQ
jgi:acid phosphatase family membrane protein YuiD